MLLFSCSVGKFAKQQAIELSTAMQNKNFESTVKFTHPKIIEMLGGKEKYLEILKTGHEEMNKIGYSYESIVLGEPSEIVKAGDELHCLIPETITMKFAGGKIISKSSLLAVSKDKGKSWTFIETAMLQEDNIKTILPNYNPALKIPKYGEPELIQNND